MTRTRTKKPRNNNNNSNSNHNNNKVQNFDSSSVVADSQNNINNNDKLTILIDTLMNSKLVESKAAAEYISAMCDLVKRQYPYYTNKQIRYRILMDCGRMFSESIITANFPSWVRED